MSAADNYAEGVDIAFCPEHGLHGCRTECFACGGPVEQIRMVPVRPTPSETDEGERLARDIAAGMGADWGFLRDVRRDVFYHRVARALLTSDWLASHDAQVAAQALDDAVKALDDEAKAQRGVDARFWLRGWLQGRARRIREEGR
jgi:hypothetical protein